MLSIVVCTYRREESLQALLDSLAGQTCGDFEIIVVDAGGGDLQIAGASVLRSAKGLPRQRNTGIRAAKGDLIGFLDDDVTVESGFVAGVIAAFARTEFHDVGGITGYDVLHYGSPCSMRFRLRKAIGYYPVARPGALGLCEVRVPLALQPPFSGWLDVSWLPGFCMIYRRAAIEGLWFDERLTAYGAEDAVFSMQVGDRWRLVMCGDLPLRHHWDPGSRGDFAEVVYGASFAQARHYLRRARGAARFAHLAWYAAMEFALDSADLARRPSALRLRTVAARQHGLLAGALSANDR